MDVIVQKFWSHVVKRGKDECWPWKKCSTKYAYFNDGTSTVLAHRFSYELKHGKGSAKGKIIRHTCDNPPCCNPNHLVKGSQQDNMNDKIARGRAHNLKGNECSWAKLNEEDVVDIKQLLKTKRYFHKTIAKWYNVHCVTITDINLGRSWRHII